MIGTLDARTAWFKRPSFAEMNAVIWRQGGRRERFFLLFGYFTVTLPLAILLLMLWWLLTGALPYEVLFSFALAALTYGAFLGPLSTAIISAKVWRHYLIEGRLHPHEDYFLEWIRVLENEGRDGLAPGAVRWTIILSAVYYGSLVIAVLFTVHFQPTFGAATPLLSAGLDAVIVLFAWIGWQLHARALNRELDRKGYHLREYAEAAGWIRPSRAVTATGWLPRTRQEALTLVGALLALALCIAIAYAFIVGWIRLGYP